MTILFVVESPGKLATISKFLGKDYNVQASKGIFRDMDPKGMNIDFHNHFEPIYIITKPDVVKFLKECMKKANMLYIATDLDREGEGIAQSLYDVLQPKQYKRILFDEITKKAIMDGIKNAGKINKNLVDAQKARRVIDRYAGYSISPILQKHLGGNLSAGRVQSPTLRLIVDREKEIHDFLEKNQDSSYFKVFGIFDGMKASLYKLDKNYDVNNKPFKGTQTRIPLVEVNEKNLSEEKTLEQVHGKVIVFLKRCLKSKFTVWDVREKIATRGPSAPFITSTLQQEANRRFGFGVVATMQIAQKLYEAGYITYMRTDSVQISEDGHNAIKEIIIDKFGNEYYQRTDYKGKTKNAQEAHEAIRPTHPQLIDLSKEINDEAQIKLYKLIWQRTVASQMKPAKIKVIYVQIAISKFIENDFRPYYYFQSQIEKITFLGFMKVYKEIKDEEGDENNIDYSGDIPKQGSSLLMNEIIAKQEFEKPPPRYTEATLVRKLEELEIGRPSTVPTIISNLLKKEYMQVKDVLGIKKTVHTYTIKTEKSKPVMNIDQDEGTIMLGNEKKKLVPTNVGISITKFLMRNFPEIMDYAFTAHMEEQLDEVSNGNKRWYDIVQELYDIIQPIVENFSQSKGISIENEVLLGEDNDGHKIYKTITKFGPVVKKDIGDKKSVYSKIKEPLSFDTITLKQAIKLFDWPKKLGSYKNSDVMLQKGQYGFYISYDGNNITIPDTIENKDHITLEEAISLIDAKNANIISEMTVNTETDKNIKVIILNGPYGPYLQVVRKGKKINYPIPKDLDPNNLTNEKIVEIISKKKVYSKKKTTGGRKIIKKKNGSKKR